MSHKVNLVRVFTAATGNSTPITLGTAYSQLFMTPAEAGAMDGRVYTYLIVDGNDWEMGRGAYTASGTSLARTTIIASRISGTLGTSRITLTGTAQVRFIEAAEDMDGVRGTRAVTGTSDVLANSDQGYVVTYSNGSAIAVSLAQAGSSNLFLAGWATMVQNLGAGTVTITPATSTINGVATLTLATGMGAFIWSDGTNYRAYFIPASKPLLAANNLSDVTAATARSNIAAAGTGADNTFAGDNTFNKLINSLVGVQQTGHPGTYGAAVRTSTVFTIADGGAANIDNALCSLILVANASEAGFAVYLGFNVNGAVLLGQVGSSFDSNGESAASGKSSVGWAVGAAQWSIYNNSGGAKVYHALTFGLRYA